MIEHHPSAETLLAYATGALSEPFGLVIAAHIHQCQPCRQAVRGLETIGGQLLHDIDPSPLTLDSAALRVRRPRVLSSLPIINARLPEPLNRVPTGWRWPVRRGIWFRLFDTRGSGWLALIDAQPGRQLPGHGHMGLELTFVIEGAFRDGEHEYRAGDVSEATREHYVDPPIVTSDQPCVCVLASEGMQLGGFIGRLQNLFGL